MPDKACPCRPSGRHFWIDERNWPDWTDYSSAAHEFDCRVRLWPFAGAHGARPVISDTSVGRASFGFALRISFLFLSLHLQPLSG
jgi:hypothetical protein